MKTKLKENEKVVLTIRKHWFVLLNPAIWTLLILTVSVYGYYKLYDTSNGYLLLIIAGLAALWFFYRLIDRANNLWAVTNLRVIDEYGVFSNNSKETPLDKINNVMYPLNNRF